MASDSKPHVIETGTVPATAAAKPSFGRRVAAHYKRWWWVHLIIFIVVVLVVVLPVIYVGYPHIAQHDINESTLNITSMAISDPTPNSFHLRETQVIGSDSAFKPNIYSFGAAISLLGGAPFITVQIPKFKAHDGVEVDVDQDVNITDTTAFAEFCKAVLLNEEIQMNVYGKADLKEGSLPETKITYNKTTSIKGLNKLEGFELVDLSISTSATSGNNGKGTVYIPNPSPFTLTMGNVTLDLSVNGTAIGKSYLTDLTIYPGNNTLPMAANVSTLTVAGMLGSYPTLMLPVDIVGNSTVYNGEELPYFSEALAANKISVELNVTKALGSVL
ncbi:DUF3712 domain-containing protein [Aspergillus saccharolyticus JOP 1030-1]|uniref:Uncharacterized protein n=1 Tax=Aspergillus saccharolyticus JOP 1030-1 TaxID=1450539 RepID=A0A318ZR42_9EURO|nr:hypothetical protein BP01DRAFT_11199 [Aspergillus saccharolyticus JOP 1030-1]PYH49986.1 hypothetical protein BP01DRAFT_11199 [Aspergillus saccharolyticus JOP 1030-1]